MFIKILGNRYTYTVLNPETIMTDFEQSCLNQYLEIFFQMFNSIIVFIISHDTYDKWSLHIRILPALAYIPISREIKKLKELLDSTF